MKDKTEFALLAVLVLCLATAAVIGAQKKKQKQERRLEICNKQTDPELKARCLLIVESLRD